MGVYWWAISAPVAGFLSDHFGRRKPIMMVGALLSFTALAATIYLPDWTHNSLRVLFFLLGCGGGTMIILFSSVKALNSADDQAAAMGFANTFVVGSGGIMQLLLGWMLDISAASYATSTTHFTTSHYRTAFLILMITTILAIVSAALIQETGKKRLRNP